MKDLERKSHEEWLRMLRLFHLEYRKAWGDLSTVYNHLKGECFTEGIDLFSQVTGDWAKENDFRLHQGRFRLRRVSSWKGLSGTVLSAQGSG